MNLFRWWRSFWLSLSRNDLSVLFSLWFFNIILFNSFKESKSWVGVSDMLNSNMDFLSNLSLLNLFFNNNTDWSWINIKDFSSSSMVKMVRHSFMNSSINNDVDIVSKSILLKIVAHSNRAVSSEALWEFMSGSWSISVRLSHVYKKFNFSYFSNFDFFIILFYSILEINKFMWLVLMVSITPLEFILLMYLV